MNQSVNSYAVNNNIDNNSNDSININTKKIVSNSVNNNDYNNGNHQRYTSVTAALVWPIVIRPLLYKIKMKNQNAACILLKALAKAECREPGFLLEFCQTILSTNNIDSINIIESLLRLQANISDADEQKCRRQEPLFQELNHRTITLKKLLAHLPDVIKNRQSFLETIKKIANAIRKLLDCIQQINAGNGYITNDKHHRSIQNRRRELIHDSKNFSQSLKDFIKNGDEKPVLQCALQLIHITNSIQNLIKTCCDRP